VLACYIDTSNWTFPIDTVEMRKAEANGNLWRYIAYLNHHKEAAITQQSTESLPGGLAALQAEHHLEDWPWPLVITPSAKTIWNRQVHWENLKGLHGEAANVRAVVDWFDLFYGPGLTPTLDERRGLTLQVVATVLRLPQPSPLSLWKFLRDSTQSIAPKS
jgi:hypothetical protein